MTETQTLSGHLDNGTHQPKHRWQTLQLLPEKKKGSPVLLNLLNKFREKIATSIIFKFYSTFKYFFSKKKLTPILPLFVCLKHVVCFLSLLHIILFKCTLE